MYTLDLGNYVQPRKRLKLSPLDISGFQHGSIIKIRLQNFVTYTLTEFNLSPSLNMIIGPNGSGKSTFVCAVCLGLGGKPEYIGRSKHITSFIKNGCDQATIETTLKDADSTLTIKRIISKEKIRNAFFIDNVQVTESAVRALVKRLNIQLDNLCQFLSQEHVEEFARLKPDKLLQETIRSIDSHILQLLNQLKELQSEEITSANEIEIKNKKLQELIKQQEKLEVSVNALKEFDEKKKHINDNTQLLPFAQMKDHKEKLETFKTDYKTAKKELKLLQHSKQKFIDSKELIETNYDKISLEEEVASKALTKYKNNLAKIREELTTLREEILRRKRQIQYYQNRTVKIKENIKLTNNELAQKQAELDTLDTPDASLFDNISTNRNKLITDEQKIKDSISEIDNKANSTNHQITQLDRKIQTQHRSLQNNDKISFLDSSTNLAELKKAVEYVRHISQDPNHSNIKNEVLEPPIITVSAKHPAFAKYISACLPNSTELALTTVNKRAQDQYGDSLLRKFKINTRELRGIPLDTQISREDLINKYGFEGYMSDFITGNPNVIQMLCEVAKLHTIPVSRKEFSPDKIKQLSQLRDGSNNPLFRRIIHGNVDLSINMSRSGKVYTSSKIITKSAFSDFYESSVMSNDLQTRIKTEIQQLNDQINTHKHTLETYSLQKSDLKHKVTELSHETNKLNSELYKLNEVRKNRSRMENDCKSIQEKLVKYREEAKKDVSVKIKEVEEQITSQLTQQASLVNDMIVTMKNITDSEKKLISKQIQLFETRNLQVSLNSLISSFNEREEILTNEYESKKQAFYDKRNSDEYQTWRTQINQYTEELKNYLSILAEQYDSEGNFTVKHIKDQIDRLESEISMMNHDASSIKILEDVVAQIKNLNETLPVQVKTLSKTRETMKLKRNELEPKLEDTIDKISKKFAVLFTQVGSAGAIKLDKPHLYNEWKIEILVKFRDNATLKKLDSHTQSGGERAVSTVLYMIALQELTSAPFRVVDEINQGMDQRNERIVHKAMVENACKENTSQYFLITPKLLTDLYYHENMRIHCVMAGPWIPNPSQIPNMEHFGEVSNFAF